MPTTHQWRPISDFEADPKTLTDGELGPLLRIWQTQRPEVTEGGAFEEFDQRLRREWAIETGIIENVYTLDRGVTKTLIEKGIDAALIPREATDRDPALVARVIEDHRLALEGMFHFVVGQRQLSTSYMKELHSALLRNQDTHTVVDQFGKAFEKPLERGEYKKVSNSPTRPDGAVHEYCPPEHVASEMDRLIEIYQEHQSSDVPPEVEAAWLHHRFSQIHPFADGNGRVARALASLVFIRAGGFPLIVKRDDRVRYIGSLEKADGQDLRPLVAMFVEAQRTALLQASEAAYSASPLSLDQAVAAARSRLVQRGKLPPKEWLTAKDTARSLAGFAEGRFQAVANQLIQEIGRVDQSFQFSYGTGSGHDDIRLTAVREAGHIADLAAYDQYINLKLDTGRSERLVVSFHGLGPRYRGIIGVVAYVVVKDLGAVPIKGGTFQINYEEAAASALKRFSTWLEQVIVEGLSEWRRTL